MEWLGAEKPTSDAAVTTSKSEWALVPFEGSCTRLGTAEPCVNKAMALLRALGEQAAKWKEEREEHDSSLGKDAQVYGERTRPSRATFSPCLEQYPPGSKSTTSTNLLQCASLSPESSETSSLVVLGTQTGTVIVRDLRSKAYGEGKSVRKQLHWLIPSAIVEHTLQLVLRLERDRRECLAAYDKVRKRVQEMRFSLDCKREERLEVLAETVQREHEQCACDISELKWHVSFDSRELGRLKQNVKIITDENACLQGEVKRLKEHVPLVEIKLEQEEDHMNCIRSEQREKDQAKLDAKDRLTDAENNTKKVTMKVNGEQYRQKQMLKELCSYLEVADGKLSRFRTQNHTLTQRVTTAEKNVESNLKLKKIKEEEWNSRKEREQYIKKRVQLLENKLSRIQSIVSCQEEKNRSLSTERNKQRRSHMSVLSSLTNNLQQKTSSLWKGREEVESIRHEMDDMRDWIASCVQQQADDIKAIERAKVDLQRVQSQLQVVEEKTSAVRREHHDLKLIYESDEMRMSSLEKDLKDAIKSLKESQHIESCRKLSYEGKIKMDRSELEKLIVEHNYKESKTLKELQSLERTRDAHQSTVNGLEEDRAKHKEREDNLTSSLNKTKQEKDAVERELSEKRQDLDRLKKELVEDEKMKRKRLEEVKENVRLVTEKTEDTQKRMEMMGKMEKDTLASIEILETKKQDLLDKVAAEKEEEDSWRRELAEISDFSTQAKEKYHHYFEESKQHFCQIEADMLSALERNEELASCYCTLMEKFIYIKGLALRRIEKHLELEIAIRDSKQLLALQTYIFPLVQTYYQHRSQAAMQELRRFVYHCSASHAQVQDLRTRFEVVLGAMHSFIKSFTGTQTEIISSRTLSKKVDVISAREPLPPLNANSSPPKEIVMTTGTRPHQKSREKVVTFSHAVTCS